MVGLSVPDLPLCTGRPGWPLPRPETTAGATQSQQIKKTKDKPMFTVKIKLSVLWSQWTESRQKNTEETTCIKTRPCNSSPSKTLESRSNKGDLILLFFSNTDWKEPCQSRMVRLAWKDLKCSVQNILKVNHACHTAKIPSWQPRTMLKPLRPSWKPQYWQLILG